MRCTRFFVGALLIGLAASDRSLAAPNADDPPKGPAAQEPPPPLSPAKTQPDPSTATDPSSDLSAWCASIKADLETLAGAKFVAEVPIKSITADDLATMLAKPVQGDMRAAGAKRPDGSAMSDVEINVRSTAAAFKVATRTFGMYRYEDKTIYVVPENAKRYAKRYGWSAETAERVPKLALAHEMVHALQDQKSKLGKRMAKASGEERSALAAVVEGQAVVITDRLAKKIDWSTANAVLWGIVTGVQSEDEPEGAAKMPKPNIPAVAPSAELYAEGKKFMEAQLAFGGEGIKGNDRLWAIIVRPPAKLAELKEPEKFIPKPELDK